MPSKYDSILPSLPSLPVADQSYQAKVDKVKADIPQADAATLSKAYAALRKLRDDVEDELSAVNLQIEAYTQLLVASQDAGEEGWGAYGASDNTLRLVTGDKVEIRKEPYAVVKDKEAHRAWAIAQGLDRLLSLPWQTTNSLAKELLMKGEQPPDGVEVFGRSKIVFTAMKQDKSKEVVEALHRSVGEL